MRYIKWIIRLPMLVLISPMMAMVLVVSIVLWAFNIKEVDNPIKDYIQRWKP